MPAAVGSSPQTGGGLGIGDEPNSDFGRQRILVAHIAARFLVKSTYASWQI